MKYFIDYDESNGRILSFLSSLNKDKKRGTLKEVTILEFLDANKYSRIIIEGENVTFVKADYMTLTDAKSEKKQELKTAFTLESNKPVEVNSVEYVGGFDSAVKLDAAKRMLETACVGDVTFFDVDNKPHILSIEDATNVILAIGSKYQTVFARYQGLKVQVDSKLKVSTVNSIVW